MNIRANMTMKKNLPTKSLKSDTTCRSLPKPTSTMASLPVIYFAATTGWRTVLYSGQLKISIRAGTSTAPPTNPQAMDKKQICKIVLQLVLLFVLYRFACVTGIGTALLLFLGYGMACFLLRVCLSILYSLCVTVLFLLFLALLIV